MNLINALSLSTKSEFRNWLKENANKEQECWIKVKRGKPQDDNQFYYLDAVEEALCFGWIDSVWKNVDGVMWSRFSKRQKKSPWTELNKERARRLIKLGLMTEIGYQSLPDLNINNFKIDEDIVKALKANKIWKKFLSFPPLYIRVRAYNVAFYKNWNKDQYDKSLKHLIETTKQGEMFGEWNDYGRLL